MKLSLGRTMVVEKCNMLPVLIRLRPLNWLAIFLLAMLSATMSAVMAKADDAGVSVQIVREGIAHRPLFAISFSEDGKRGVAVGDRGTVIFTNDGGNSWMVENAGTDLAILGVSLVGAQMIGVGQMGLVVVRVEDGEWVKQSVDVDERLMSVDLHPDGLAVAVGGFGQVRISTDGGAMWSAPDTAFSSFVEEGYDPNLYAVEITRSGRIIVAGEFGLILISDDRGVSWQVARRGDESLSALDVREDGIGFAVGQDGIVLKTVDFGDHWERVDPGLGGNLLGVSSTPEGLVVVPGMRNMLVSHDDGATFAPVENADVNSNWYQQAAAGLDAIFVVGYTGRILRISTN